MPPTIAEWLERLGLAEYAARFVENGIDVAVLPELTDADLRDLDVKLGHRRRILSAVRQTARPDAAAPSSDVAERRQLTVMFCDLVGSTSLATQLDPEDLREVIGAYHRTCAKLIEAHGGFVAKYMGDGVLAYFGYPQAHEHDAEHAVKAGLGLVAAMRAAPSTATGAVMQVRVGIATGIVVVGDLLGSGEAQERGIVGDTPNLAARLQTIAQPSQVVIADATRRMLGELFDFVDMGALHLKGIAGASRAWTAVRENAQVSRFEALYARGAEGLVGRTAEIERLAGLWNEARAGTGWCVEVSGEAGVGKSGLTEAFVAGLLDKHAQQRFFCSPQSADTPLSPFIGQLERAAGFKTDDDAAAKLDKLDAWLAALGAPVAEAALIADILGLPSEGRYPVVALTPQARRSRALNALVALVERHAARLPLLLVFEDAHWADASSLELIGRIIDRLGARRILILVTGRPEFHAPWAKHPRVSEVKLGRLSPTEVSALINQIAGDRALAPAIKQDIIERSDGVPLFVEEMTRAVLEAQSEDAAERVVGQHPAPRVAVPASLHASLMARLDRLGPAKRAAQAGAAIGREFSLALLAAVMADTNDLGPMLGQLVGSGLVQQRGEGADTAYVFKHALVRDAAYGTMLRDARRAHHARIVTALEAQTRGIAETRPELLALHCAEAGLAERSALLWGQAGLQSLARSALIEAENQLNRALAQLAALPGAPVLRREQIKLQLALGNTLVHTAGYAAAATRACFEKTRALMEAAADLGEAFDDPLAAYAVLYGSYVEKSIAFDGAALRELTDQFTALARKDKHASARMLSHRMAGVLNVCCGDIAAGRAMLTEADALYDPMLHQPLTVRFGQDSRVVTYYWRALAHWLLGRHRAARLDGAAAMRTADESMHAPSLMLAMYGQALINGLSGDCAATLQHATALVALCTEKGAVFWRAAGVMAHGHALLLAGDADAAAGKLREGIADYRSTGATVYLPYHLSLLAEALARTGRIEPAWDAWREAAAMIEASHERWAAPELHRIAGLIALASPHGDHAAARGHFERALAIAGAQQSKSWELAAATDLAALLAQAGDERGAHALLAPIHGHFTEGVDTPPLRRAQALLHALA